MASNQRQQPQNEKGPIEQHIAVIHTQKQARLSVQQAPSPSHRRRRRWTTWTGFSDRNLWHWLNLLIIPTILALVPIGFSMAQNQQQNAIYVQQLHDQQQDTLANNYMNRITSMSIFIEDPTDTHSRNNDRILASATSQTITVLEQLDGKRRGEIIQFLHDEQLIATPTPIISLSGASIENADLIHANLSGADLSHADLIHANLSGADLSGADLSKTILSGAILDNARLHRADLHGADLRLTDLRLADLSGANPRGANLSGADLKDAHTDEGQLAQAQSLQYAIMPNGSHHS